LLDKYNIKPIHFTRFLSLICLIAFNIQYCFGQETDKEVFKGSDTLSNEYIIDHKKQFNVKLEVGNEISSFKLIENSTEVDLSPSLNIRYAVVLSYKFLSVRIGIRPKISDSEKEEKGDSDTFRLKLQLLFDYWNHIIEYNNYRGFYVKNSNNYVSNTSGNYIQFPDLTTHVVFGSSVYKFNKNYSMRAIQSQTEIQSKSAGSFMPGLAYTFYSISGTNKIKNIEDGETITRDYFNEYKGVNLALQFGYYYTLVFQKNWFLNGFGIPAVGVDLYSVDNNTPTSITTRNYKDSFFSLSYGGGVGYNGKKIFFGALYKTRFSNEKFSSSRFHIIPTKDEFSVYFGYRFRAPKTISKPIDLIEEKVPILKDDNN